MGHLLMVESWVGANGKLLPQKIREKNHSYTLVTRDPHHYGEKVGKKLHPVLALAEDVITLETNNFQELLAAVETSRYDGILTICDYYIDMVRTLSETTGLSCPFPSRVKELREKHCVRKKLDRAGLPNARYALGSRWEEVKEEADRLGYPLIVKPVDLASSAFVQKVEGEADLYRAFLDLDAFEVNFREQPREKVYLLEEYLEGPEFSVESVLFRGELTTLGITDKSVTGYPYCIEDSHMFPANLDLATEDIIINYVHDVLSEIRFDQGIAHTELKLTPEGPKIVEINCRPGGNYITELLELVTGVDLLDVFVDLSLGIPPYLKKSDMAYQSAAVAFLLPPKEGILKYVSGMEELKQDDHIYRWYLEDFSVKKVGKPVDNAAYLGHVLACDVKGREARKYAEAALEKLTLCYAEV